MIEVVGVVIVLLALFGLDSVSTRQVENRLSILETQITFLREQLALQNLQIAQMKEVLETIKLTLLTKDVPHDSTH